MARLQSGTEMHSRFWETAAAMWSAVVVALAVVPWRNVEMLTEQVSDKTLHALAFVLGGLVWAGSVEKNGNKARAAGFSLVICLLLGGLIEIVQGATRDRTAEFGDFVSDAIGAGIGILIWIALHRLTTKSNN